MMSSLWFYSNPIDRLHQENWRFLLRKPWKKPPEKTDPMALAGEAEYLVMERIQAMGYMVIRTCRNRPYDLCVEGVRVEVKASLWYLNKRGGRYQACIHHHDSDVLVFDCVNGAHHFFVIPMAEVAPRRNVAIWAYDPTEYLGLWTNYLEAWEHVTHAVKAAHRAWQPPLFINP